LLRVSNGEIGRIVVDALQRFGNKLDPDSSAEFFDLADFEDSVETLEVVNAFVILFEGFVGLSGNGFLPRFFGTLISAGGIVNFEEPKDNAACFNFPFGGTGLCCRGLSVGVRMPCV
jgi:hypothetical protein